MSSQYAFFAGILRFVAKKTATDDADIQVMMGHLAGIADAVEKTGQFMILRENCESAARGFAGVAKFLQERILPEALADGNKGAVEQLKWAIETSLALAAELVKRITVADYEGQASFTFDLPQPPGAPKPH
ncbi:MULTISPECIES: hypothetical protein [unclassified Thalassospira]|uniref:hypothetical protein n=1 Tax=unclassified Thalassospira TaxID=2648997 RepID=UPI000A1D9D05|nr:hypothetical protein [Thalassospira sp. MCCC 1A01428]OSQ36916.1 hypothetical protein THS27_23045 [Thalassospira sp. MCCC 1A01428]